MNLERSTERLIQEALPVEQSAWNMENPPAFVRQEYAEEMGDAPPRIERGSIPESLTMGRTIESGPCRKIYRPDPPKDMLLTTQERAKAALAQEQGRRSHPGTGIH